MPGRRFLCTLLLWAAACAPELDCDVRTGPVAELHWADAGSGWIEGSYGTDRLQVDLPVLPVAAGAGRVALAGLPAGSLGGAELIHDDGRRRRHCVVEGIERPPAPEELPAVHTEQLGETSEAAFVLAGLRGSTRGQLALSRSGRVVWSRLDPEAERGLDVQLRRGRRSMPELLSAWIGEKSSERELRIDDLSGGALDALPAPGSHHVFTQGPEGCLAWIAMDVRDWYDPTLGREVPVVGDGVVEACPGGQPVQIYSTWDHLEPSRHDEWRSDFYEEGRDWTHTNGLHWSEERRSYTISFAHLDAVVELDRNGRVLREIRTGSPEAYTLEAGSTPFAFPHDPRWTEAGTLLLFQSSEERSWAIEYEVDDASRRLRELRACGEQLDLRAPVLGQARRLSNGHWWINWASAGVVVELDPHCRERWRMELPSGEWWSQAYLVDSFHDVQ